MDTVLADIIVNFIDYMLQEYKIFFWGPYAFLALVSVTYC